MADPLFEAVVKGYSQQAKELVVKKIEAGGSAVELLNQLLIPAMQEVGARFERNEYYIPHMLMSAQAMKSAMEVLKPWLVRQDIQPLGKMVIGTVKGDMHDIGKNLVRFMFEGSGFEVIDLGTDVTADKFVSALQTHQAQLLACSALLTSTMMEIPRIVKTIRSMDNLRSVRILVGGAPVTQQFAREIGADGYSDNAFGAVRIAKELIDR